MRLSGKNIIIVTGLALEGSLKWVVMRLEGDLGAPECKIDLNSRRKEEGKERQCVI
ncbi:hypothetical protein SAMN05216316_1992 [Nitrosovibrio sp. Nv6]|nr:hypothetical protein SAMN05216316_1992 [Nitrosovibrio sp. Nv6]